MEFQGNGHPSYLSPNPRRLIEQQGESSNLTHFNAYDFDPVRRAQRYVLAGGECEACFEAAFTALLKEMNFEKQAKENPNAIAVIFENQKISYGELNQRANQLAAHLRELGVKTETLVAVSLERSLELLISVLPVLEAGGGYVPLAPTYPKGR